MTFAGALPFGAGFGVALGVDSCLTAVLPLGEPSDFTISVSSASSSTTMGSALYPRPVNGSATRSATQSPTRVWTLEPPYFCFSKMVRYLEERSFSSSHFSRMCFSSPSTSIFCLSSSASWRSCARFSAAFA